MKPSHYLFILFALLLAGCTKESVSSPSAEQTGQGTTYTPTGNVAVYIDSLGIRPFTESGSPCTHLCFAIYDTNGVRVKQTNQKRGDNHYGAVGFLLDEGCYRLVVVAHSSSRNPTMTDSAKIKFNNGTGYTDTYLYHSTIEATPSQQKLHVSPRRITALCRFVVADTIPDSITQMRFTYTGGSAHFDAMTGWGVTASTQTVVFDATPSLDNSTYDLYTIPFGTKEDTLQLTVAALDAEGGKTLERQFEVPVHCDQITWLSGYFFSTSDRVVIPTTDPDSDWGSEVYQNY